jgi:hypothetical protein
VGKVKIRKNNRKRNWNRKIDYNKGRGQEQKKEEDDEEEVLNVREEEEG